MGRTGEGLGGVMDETAGWEGVMMTGDPGEDDDGVVSGGLLPQCGGD